MNFYLIWAGVFFAVALLGYIFGCIASKYPRAIYVVIGGTILTAALLLFSYAAASLIVGR